MRRHNKGGALSASEKQIVKGLLNRDYRNQDIQHLINIGRDVTVNSARITEVRQNSKQKAASKSEVNRFLAAKSEHDYKTGLNPYEHPRLIAAREAMMLAASIFNNPTLKFRAKSFAVHANIAWTNAMHAFYESKGISIWKGDKTLPLSQLIKREDCPLEKAEIENLKAIKKIRDEVEHFYWMEAEEAFVSIFQACCANFDQFLIKNFGRKTAISNEMGLALQYRNIDFQQAANLASANLPPQISALNTALFDNAGDDISLDPKYAFNVAYTLTATSKGKAHINFISPETQEDQEIHNVLVKEVPSDKKYPHKPSHVCKQVENRTGKSFTMHDHTMAWKNHEVRPKHKVENPEKTITEFCHYDKPHGDYLYSDAWVDKLVAEVNDEKIGSS